MGRWWCAGPPPAWRSQPVNSAESKATENCQFSSRNLLELPSISLRRVVRLPSQVVGSPPKFHGDRDILKAFDLDPPNGYVAALAGGILDRLGDHDLAEEILERAAAIGPPSAEAQEMLGNHYAQTGALERAIDCFRSAASINSASQGAYRLLGGTLAQIGDYEEAALHLRRAIELRPDDK